MTLRPALVALCGVLVAGGSSTAEAARKRPSSTLGALTEVTAPIDRSVAVQADVAETTRSYEAFLRIEDADPVLRAQALRRLGDLRLEQAVAPRATAKAAMRARMVLGVPSPYDRIEFGIWYVIAEAFDLELEWSHELPAIVKQADHELVRIEAEVLWGPEPLPPEWGPLPAERVDNAERYAPLRWPGPLAAARYLSMFGDLVLARHGEVLR